MIISKKINRISVKQHLAFLFLLCCLPISQLFAAGEPTPKAAVQITVPGGNPNIYLRMPLKELLQQRKNAKPFVLFDSSHSPPNPEVLTQTLSEDYEKDAQFQNGLYFVRYGFILAIVLGSQSQGKIPGSGKMATVLSNMARHFSL